MYALAMEPEHAYVGRYAPSPTGDLHLGNLRTALLAWLLARLNQGVFLLRMEDLDTPRCVPGSADQILRDLEWLGLDWDGDVVFQSQRQALYQAALKKLQDQNLLYACFCSRKDIHLASSAPHQTPGVYPGTCANLSESQVSKKSEQKTAAIRIRVNDQIIQFEDACLGHQQQQLASEVGDFVLRRADGLFAYQLAVVVDDYEQGITSVVRGADLIDSSARQIYLFERLGTAPPQYCHVPLMLDADGKRMAKRDGSESAGAWRSEGKSAEQLIGVLAHGLGLTKSEAAISLSELADSLDPTTVMQALNQAAEPTLQGSNSPSG